MPGFSLGSERSGSESYGAGATRPKVVTEAKSPATQHFPESTIDFQTPFSAWPKSVISLELLEAHPRFPGYRVLDSFTGGGFYLLIDTNNINSQTVFPQFLPAFENESMQIRTSRRSASTLELATLQDYQAFLLSNNHPGVKYLMMEPGDPTKSELYTGPGALAAVLRIVKERLALSNPVRRSIVILPEDAQVKIATEKQSA